MRRFDRFPVRGQEPRGQHTLGRGETLPLKKNSQRHRTRTPVVHPDRSLQKVEASETDATPAPERWDAAAVDPHRVAGQPLEK